MKVTPSAGSTGSRGDNQHKNVNVSVQIRVCVNVTIQRLCSILHTYRRKTVFGNGSRGRVADLTSYRVNCLGCCE